MLHPESSKFNRVAAAACLISSQHWHLYFRLYDLAAADNRQRRRGKSRIKAEAVTKQGLCFEYRGQYQGQWQNI